MALKIEEIKAGSPHIDTVAKWLNSQWGQAQGYSLSETFDWCTSLANAEDEAVFAATKGQRILGAALVVECDLIGYEIFKPWLSGLYVMESARGNEIGRLLINAACDWSARMGHEKIYLYAPDGSLINYYRNGGWDPLADFERGGESFKIMAKPLGGTPT